jgi:hypothetical protein
MDYPSEFFTEPLSFRFKPLVSIGQLLLRQDMVNSSHFIRLRSHSMTTSPGTVSASPRS